MVVRFIPASTAEPFIPRYGVDDLYIECVVVQIPRYGERVLLQEGDVDQLISRIQNRIAEDQNEENDFYLDIESDFSITDLIVVANVIHDLEDGYVYVELSNLEHSKAVQYDEWKKQEQMNMLLKTKKN